MRSLLISTASRRVTLVTSFGINSVKLIALTGIPYVMSFFQAKLWNIKSLEWWMMRVGMITEMSWQVNEDVSREMTGGGDGTLVEGMFSFHAITLCWPNRRRGGVVDIGTVVQNVGVEVCYCPNNVVHTTYFVAYIGGWQLSSSWMQLRVMLTVDPHASAHTARYTAASRHRRSSSSTSSCCNTSISSLLLSFMLQLSLAFTVDLHRCFARGEFDLTNVILVITRS